MQKKSTVNDLPAVVPVYPAFRPKPLKLAGLLYTIMKVTLVQMTVAMIFSGVCIAFDNHAQEILNRKISLEIRETSLMQTLGKIEKAAEVKFVYSPARIDLNEIISLDVSGERLGALLSELLTPRSIKFAVQEGEEYIVLVENETIESPLPPAIEMSQSNIVLQTITGTVTDQNGVSLPGVNIIVKGTTNGTTTDAQGQYSLAVRDENAVLVFSFIGYTSQEVAVNGRTVINVVMSESAQTLNEVVVVGYGTKEKGQLTGSLFNLSGEDLTPLRTTDLTKSLQGRVPGLILQDLGGAPGREEFTLLVRGTHTLGDNSPLFVIDGVPRSGFGQLSANDIDEITVLKDASAAIYGARAANGVIVVKTKRGNKSGGVDVQVNTNYGVNKLTRMPKFMDSWQYAIYQNETQERTGGAPLFSEEDIQKYKSGDYPLTHPNTDWYRAAFKDFAPEVNHNVSISGGNENVQYYISGDYLSKKSNYSSDDGYYNQYQMRSNIDAQVHKNLKLGVDISLRKEEDRQPPAGISNITHRAWFNWPTEVARFPNGLPGYVHEHGNTTVINSFETGFDEVKNRIIQTKLSFDLKLDWLTPGLGLIGYSAFDYVFDENTIHQKPVMTYDYNPSTGEYEEILSTYPGGGRTTLRKKSGVSRNDLYHVRLAYDRSFNAHNISAFIAYEQNESEYNWMSAYRRDLFSPSKVELFAGGEDGRDVDGSSSVAGRVNYFGSFSYDYKRKYLFDFTIRRDGSFNFPKDNRFGIFPSMSAGWNIAKEPFMAGTSQAIDNLKLRVSYGRMGNDRVADFQYLTKYVLGSYAIFGESSIYNAGISIANIPNPDITWETADVLNYGVDAALWNGKLEMNLDVFYEKRRGILIRRNLSVPDYTALSLPDENLGKVDNSGLELMLSHNNHVGELKFNVGGNFTFNRSKIVYMDESKDVPEYQKQEGFPVNSILSYEADGIFRDQAELDAYPHLPGAIPGDIKYVDVNGDGEISNVDQRRYYSSPTPEIQFGLNAAFYYKNFELLAMFQGQTNAMTVLMYNDGGGKPVEVFNQRWTKDNVDSEHPRAFAGFDSYQRQSSYHHQDASYLRLKHLELAYDFSSVDFIPEKLFKRCRLYLRCRNLWTLDHIKIFDPEVPYAKDYSRGSRAKYYPQLITYSAGLNLTF